MVDKIMTEHKFDIMKSLKELTNSKSGVIFHHDNAVVCNWSYDDGLPHFGSTGISWHNEIPKLIRITEWRAKAVMDEIDALGNKVSVTKIDLGSILDAVTADRYYKVYKLEGNITVVAFPDPEQQ